MFLSNTRRGYKQRSGDQFCHGLFLMVFSHPTTTESRPELRALVRHAKMTQCGHWMMADVKIGGYELTLSGTYGSDGLPMRLDRHSIDVVDGKARFASFTDEEKLALWEHLVPIPAELQTAFWEGGGHNTSGKEGPLLKKWAEENLKLLRKEIPTLKK
jgi:hypothetical protein